MRFRTLGPSGLQASIVGLGTWPLGGGSVWGGAPDETVSIRTIQAAIDAGVNLIDTAPAYGFGESERVVGRAIRGRRQQVLLATKCGLWWQDRRGAFFGPFDGKRLFRSLRKETLQIELEDSLRRLGVETIDLYQVHWPSAEPDRTPIEETMDCLQRFRQAGKIRAIGVANPSVNELRTYVDCGAVTCQARWNLLWRQVRQDLLPFCRTRGVGFLGWAALEQGLLTGQVGLDRTFGPKEYRSNYVWNPWFHPDQRPRVLGLLDRWQDLTAKYACTLAQLAIAWAVSQAGVSAALCGARSPDQAMENAAAGDLELAAEDLQRIESDLDALGGV